MAQGPAKDFLRTPPYGWELAAALAVAAGWRLLSHGGEEEPDADQSLSGDEAREQA